MTQDVWEFSGGSVAQRRRFRKIMDVLFEKGFASVDELVATLSVSRMTVHRDLDELDSRGALTKVRGGATVARTEQFESSWEYRARLAIDAKRAIAAKAVEYVESGDSLIIDPSSTAHQFSKLLPAKTPLTVVTATLPVLAELSSSPGIELHSVGGVYDSHFRSFMGDIADLSVRNFRVDKAFMSMAAVSGRTICHSQAKAIHLDRAFFEVARMRILMVDSTKFGHSALHVFSDAAEWDVIITDNGAARSDLEALRIAGTEVVVVDVPEPNGDED